MTLTLLPHPTDDGDDVHAVREAVLERHYGVVAATQMLRAKEVTPLEYLALCEEAADMADHDRRR